MLIITFILTTTFSEITQAQTDSKSSSNQNITIQLTPSSADPSLLISDDLDLDLLLHEPTVAKPLYLTFDERGRLWVVQYRQYPWPAGLKLLSRDSVWRNIYDPPFAPPPPHAEDSPYRGQDRITIHEDTDGDGVFDHHKVFLDGLNLATAALPGRQGVFVLNPPYLLFYHDQNQDDVPDRPEPDILLSGFGFEDSHALANSLRWGPDGWIYATQGSTVTSNVVHHDEQGNPITDQPAIRSMGQNVWRYHPERRKYEIFAEGGGNAFGVEIDNQGRIFSGHNGGNTRGFHYLPGGYWQKTFSKHGQLSNPYAFDYHRPMRHNAAQRFTHMFTIYDADHLPERYRGKMLALNPIENRLVLSNIFPDGSSVQTRDLGDLIRPTKAEKADWFTPVDGQIGPDGALYLADWYDVQSNHYRNHEGKIDPTIGRIIRMRNRDYTPTPPFNLSEISSEELAQHYLNHPNRWFRQQALRLLGDRKDQSIAPLLWKQLQENQGQLALESLWALEVTGALTDEQLANTLKHSSPSVRSWSVRLLSDRPKATIQYQTNLIELAQQEPDLETRSIMAAAAKQMPAETGIPLAYALLQRTEDVKDVYIPRTLWWALEAHADHSEIILKGLESSAIWKSPFRVADKTIPQCLILRWAMSGNQQHLNWCARLFELAPDQRSRDLLIESFSKAFEGRSFPRLPDQLVNQLAKSKGPFAEVLAVRQGDQQAILKAIQTLKDPQITNEHRCNLIQAVSETGADFSDQILPILHQLLKDKSSANVKNETLMALQRLGNADSGQQILNAWAQLEEPTRLVALQTLSSRREWFEVLIEAFEKETIDRSLMDVDAIARMNRLATPELQNRLEQLFPSHEATAEDLNQKIELLSNVVRSGQGSPLKGKELYFGKLGCAKCHKLFDSGTDLGPDLTAYNRSNISRMMLALVNPSAEIREGYETYTVILEDGRLISGFKIEDNDQVIAIRSVDDQVHTISRDQIDEILPNPTSMMPAGLLDGLSDEEIRDLFAYLSSTTPPL